MTQPSEALRHHQEMVAQETTARQQRLAELSANLAYLEDAVYGMAAHEEIPFDPDDPAKHRFYLAGVSNIGDYPLVVQMRTPKEGAHKVSIADLMYNRRAAWTIGARTLEDLAYHHPLGRLHPTVEDQLQARAMYGPQFLSSVSRLVSRAVVYSPQEYSLKIVRSIPEKFGKEGSHDHGPTIHGILTALAAGATLETMREHGVISVPENELELYRAPISGYKPDAAA